MADGLQLVDELRVREKLGHRPERKAPEVLVESCDDHPDATLGEGERARDDALTEELSLVDTDDVESLRTLGHLGDGRDRDRALRAPAWLTTSVAS